MKRVCIHGHDTFILGRNSQGRCKECERQRNLVWVQKNLDRVNETHRKWRQEHSTRVKALGHNWRINNPKKTKNASWKKQGITTTDGIIFTTVDFDRLYQLQQGKCAICKIHQSDLKQALCVDHDHKTGVVRGLLCFSCNFGLGIHEKMKIHFDEYLNRIPHKEIQ